MHMLSSQKPEHPWFFNPVPGITLEDSKKQLSNITASSGGPDKNPPVLFYRSSNHGKGIFQNPYLPFYQ